ncbi:MAG: ABC transporter permease [Acetivibrio ethanolgignens]
MMKKLRKPLLLSGLFLLGVIFSSMSYCIGRRLPDQLAAKRWASDDTRYTQVSVFLGGGRVFSENDVNSFRVNLSRKLEEASLKAKTKSARLWVDAYSTELTGSAALGRVNEDVMITAVGGDFFQFHPMELVSGYYFRPDELMNDRVVIDETLAWKLFGSSDVVGMDFELDGQKCFVAAVAKNPSGRVEEYAYGSKPRVYAPLKLTGLLDAGAGENGLATGSITCYEVLIPNPVKDFGKKIVTEYLFGEVKAGEEELAKARRRMQDIEVVENTTRYQPLPLLQLVKTFGIRSMRENQIRYPYWENIARVWEDYGSAMLFMALAAFILPLVVTLRFLHNKWKHRKWRKEVLFHWFEKKREASWEKRRKIENEKN